MSDITQKPKKQLKTSFEELRHVARSTSRNPKLFFTLLGINLFFCTAAYYPYLGFGKALLSALLLTVIWAVVFALVPYVLNLLIGLIFLSTIIYLFISISKTSDPLTAAIAIFMGLIILAVVLGLLLWAAVLLPGMLLGFGTYGLLGRDAYAAGAAIGVFALTTLGVYFVLRYVVPFLIGFSWAFLTGVLAHRLTGSPLRLKTTPRVIPQEVVPIMVILGISYPVLLPGEGGSFPETFSPSLRSLPAINLEILSRCIMMIATAPIKV